MSMLGRFGTVVKSEWNARFGDGDGPSAADEAEAEAAMRGGASAVGAPPGRSSTSMGSSVAPTLRVHDVEGALRVLELSGTPTLDEVRAQYRALARHYHPRTQSDVADQVHAAHTVLLALTEALELLEEHLLPLPPAAAASR